MGKQKLAIHPKAKQSPELVLRQILDIIGDVSHLVVVYKTKDGFLDTFLSEMSLEQEAMLATTLQNRLYYDMETSREPNPYR